MAYERLIYTNADGESVELSPHSTYWTNFKKDVTGFADVEAELTTIDMIGDNGSSWVRSRISEKTITITGAIYASNKVSTTLARRELNHVLNPLLAGTLTYIYNGTRRTIECHPVTAPSYTDTSIYQRYSIDLTCTDPFWHNAAYTKQKVVGFSANWFWIEDGTYIIEDSFYFGKRDSSGYVDVNNSGDAEVGAIFTITATQTASGIKIYNIDTDEYLQYDGTVEPGCTLAIDTRKGYKTATLTDEYGNETDVFANINTGSTFLQLGIGSNRMKMSAETGDARYISVYATYYPAYLGV